MLHDLKATLRNLIVLIKKNESAKSLTINYPTLKRFSNVGKWNFVN